MVHKYLLILTVHAEGHHLEDFIPTWSTSMYFPTVNTIHLNSHNCTYASISGFDTTEHSGQKLLPQLYMSLLVFHVSGLQRQDGVDMI